MDAETGVQPNAQYNVAAADSLPARVAAWQRRHMYAAFVRALAPTAEETVLDVGVTSDQGYSHSNYFEAWYPHKQRITACGLDDARFLEAQYPGLRFVQADGRDLPFEDGQFDIVHSAAVIEHVGNFDNQAKFIRELWRVSRRGIFVTTPNRWFPVEFHTVLPLVHWLPKPVFRGLMRRSGRAFFADENNLNLMTRRELMAAARVAGIAAPRVDDVTMALWPTNLLLVGQRR